MSFRLGARSKRELNGVHPELRQVVEIAISISAVDFSVHDGLRTVAEQTRLVERGASRTMRSKHLKQASTGFGHAVDLVPFINGKMRWEWDPIYEIAEAMHRAATDYGVRLRWGGVWDRSFTRLDRQMLEWEVEQYGDRQRARGRRVFTDGPHYEIKLS